MKNIVIVGAGFAGLRCALKLEKKLRNLRNEWSVILIDRNTYHTYTVALYEVASAYRLKGVNEKNGFEELLGSSVSLPIRTIVEGKNIHFVQEEVSGVDFVHKKVQTKNGDNVPFEYLVLALGSEMMHFGIEGVKECCYSLKTLSDAFTIRRKLEETFSRYSGKDIEIIMVGGGFSGVEIIAEIATYARHLARDYAIEYSKVHVSLLEAGETILPQAHGAQRKNVEKCLKKLGINIRVNTRITKAHPDCVMVGAEEKCEADVILWGGGVQGPELLKHFEGVDLGKRGRIVVDTFLQVKGINGVFAVGDNALFIDEKSGKPAPATAFIAEQQADHTVRNIIACINEKNMREYRASVPGYVVSCGGKRAVARIYGITFSGFLGWTLKKAIDLKYFLSLLPYEKAFVLWLRELRLFTKND